MSRKRSSTLCLALVLGAGLGCRGLSERVQRSVRRSTANLAKSFARIHAGLPAEMGRLGSATRQAAHLADPHRWRVLINPVENSALGQLIRLEQRRVPAIGRSLRELFGRGEWARIESAGRLAVDMFTPRPRRARDAWRMLVDLWRKELSRPQLYADGVFVVDSQAVELFELVLR